MKSSRSKLRDIDPQGNLIIGPGVSPTLAIGNTVKQ
jgi:hypothetical protein